MRSEGRGIIEINDELTLRGLELLKSFISKVDVRGKNVRRALAQLINLVEGNYLPFVSVDALSDNNVIDAWNEYRNDFVSWLKGFIEKYGIEVPLDDLPIDYRARVAVLTAMLLARDLIEVHYYALSSEARQIVDGTVINWGGVSLSLYDLVRYAYPIMLWAAMGAAITRGTEVMPIVSIFSEKAKALYEVTKSRGRSGGGEYKVYKLMYMPLIITGLMNEDVLYKLIKSISPEMVPRDKTYRFNVTGLGQAFLKISALVFRHSLSTAYYSTAIAVLTAISHVHDIVLSKIINQVLKTDIYGNVEFMQSEYARYNQYAASFSDVYRLAYTHDNALRDLSAMTLTLINIRNELNELAQKSKAQDVDQVLNTLINKYPFLASGTVNELVRDAIKVIWLTSGSIT
jgi:hypothetical protein